MTQHIVILGAGYAGLGAATRAARLLGDVDVRITVVTRCGSFVERVRLHQLAVGQQLSEWPLERVLAGTTVQVVVANVIGIDLDERTVRLEQSSPIRYDTLVYALGSGADVDRVPGVREQACSIASVDDALRLRDRIRALRAGSPVVVVGGGLTGIETAAEIAETHPRLHVQLVSDPPPGHWLTPRAQQHLRRALCRLAVEVHTGRATKVSAEQVSLDTGQSLPTDATVWAAGFAVPSLAADAGVDVNARGQVAVDSCLRSVSHPEVYAIGDAAAATTRTGTASRMSCQTALPMGRYVAAELSRTMAGRPSKPINIRYVWQNISLGRRDGVTQFTRYDDAPTGAEQ